MQNRYSIKVLTKFVKNTWLSLYKVFPTIAKWKVIYYLCKKTGKVAWLCLNIPSLSYLAFFDFRPGQTAILVIIANHKCFCFQFILFLVSIWVEKFSDFLMIQKKRNVKISTYWRKKGQFLKIPKSKLGRVNSFWLYLQSLWNWRIYYLNKPFYRTEKSDERSRSCFFYPMMSKYHFSPWKFRRRNIVLYALFVDY